VASDLIDSGIQEIEAHIDLKFNDVQKYRWAEVLGNYDEDVLISGWQQLIDSLIPNRKPAIYLAVNIFDRLKAKFLNEYQAPNELTTDQKSFGSKVAISCFKSFDYARKTNGGKSAYHSDQSRFWRDQMNDPEMARKHKVLANAKKPKNGSNIY
tara:strand:- start:2118 stop:2579 length:462 start_codon:yes stop_codon:yes gene_type:complete